MWNPNKINIPRPPPPVICVLLLWLFVAVIERFYAPSSDDRDAWANFQGAVLLASAIAGLAIWRLFYHPGCTLFFTDERYFDEYERVEEWQAPCGKPSVGKVKVSGFPPGIRYFCREHDPESRWMKEWLSGKKLTVLEATKKRFTFHEDDPQTRV